MKNGEFVCTPGSEHIHLDSDISKVVYVNNAAHVVVVCEIRVYVAHFCWVK